MVAGGMLHTLSPKILLRSFSTILHYEKFSHIERRSLLGNPQKVIAARSSHCPIDSFCSSHASTRQTPLLRMCSKLESLVQVQVSNHYRYSRPSRDPRSPNIYPSLWFLPKHPSQLSSWWCPSLQLRTVRPLDTYFREAESYPFPCPDLHPLQFIFWRFLFTSFVPGFCDLTLFPLHEQQISAVPTLHRIFLREK